MVIDIEEIKKRENVIESKSASSQEKDSKISENLKIFNDLIDHILESPIREAKLTKKNLTKLFESVVIIKGRKGLSNEYLKKVKLVQVLLDSLIGKEEIEDEFYNQLTIEQRIKYYKYLPDNWDGYGAKPLSSESVKHALVFLRRLKQFKTNICFVYPTGPGYVGIDFKNTKVRVESKIISIGKISFFYKEKGKSSISQEVSFTKFLKQLNQFFK
jgi:hypothetical protein